MPTPADFNPSDLPDDVIAIVYTTDTEPVDISCGAGSAINRLVGAGLIAEALGNFIKTIAEEIDFEPDSESYARIMEAMADRLESGMKGLGDYSLRQRTFSL